MSLSPEEVRKIAHLARLDVGDDDVESYAGELSRILELVDRMNAVDTSGVGPMAHPQHAVQRLRPDAVTESDQRERYQRLATVLSD